jgi:hypothetical protein
MPPSPTNLHLNYETYYKIDLKLTKYAITEYNIKISHELN